MPPPPSHWKSHLVHIQVLQKATGRDEVHSLVDERTDVAVGDSDDTVKCPSLACLQV